MGDSQPKRRGSLSIHDARIAGLYDLEKTIGKGHFAVVKLASHVFTGEKVLYCFFLSQNFCLVLRCLCVFSDFLCNMWFMLSRYRYFFIFIGSIFSFVNKQSYLHTFFAGFLLLRHRY